MESIIELQRQEHEEMERYEQALADILNKPVTGRRGDLRNQHKALDVLNRLSDRQRLLKTQYEDAEGLRAAEIAALSVPASSANGGNPQNDLTEFYARFDRINKVHQDRQASGTGQEPELRSFLRSLEELVKSDGLEHITLDDGEEEVIDPLDTMFTGEESMGRYLDLYIPHTQFVNLKSARRLTYMQYLNMLSKGLVGETIDQKEKESAAYLDYVQTLNSYLHDFLRRTHPLEMGTVDAALKPVEEGFEKEWKEGKVEGWQRKAAASTQTNGDVAQAEEGIWCAACQKQYTKKTVYDAHLTSKKHIKAAERLAADGGAATPEPVAKATPSNAAHQAATSKAHAAALLTRLTETLLLLPPVPALINDTKQNIERKSALTAREREQEVEEAMEETNVVQEEKAEEEEDDGRIYNPLKLPLGWDGKPIPYWLYKLHGLGVEYKCEICSDYVYMGRKAFDRHFQESRHAFGMRALGLPNTKHFHEITKIADALALAERLKREGRQEQNQAERTEEFEDAEGNVYDKKTYEDLKRQGLL
ncbi:Pre-mRNA-splicing factor sap61 [Naganishia albida]|nr:Pre-mRNA-splicing factor sap61 [Naganishia albida]